jgi:WD40 repeat protein
MMVDFKSAYAQHWKLEYPALDMTLNRQGLWAMITMGNGSLAILPAADTGVGPSILGGHEGVSLCCVPDAEDHAFLSGGSDGRLLLVDPEVDVPTALVEGGGHWIDHAAAHSGGFRAYACGKTLCRLDEAGKVAAPPVDMPSSIGGLSFSPHGTHLAITHYGGVHVYWAKEPQKDPLVLSWKGALLNMTWSPDGQIMLAALQDGGIHGWKIKEALTKPEDSDQIHMHGYAKKIHSMAFSAGGKFLVTSGAQQAICWAFSQGRPWDNKPLALGGIDARYVVRVAPHPRDEMVAVGYDDGMIVLAPLDGRMEVLILPPSANAVVGLAWNNEADALIGVLESGDIYMFTVKSVSRFVRGQVGS